MRQVRLALTSVGVFFLIPVAGAAVLLVLALGLVATLGLCWGLLSAAGWLLLHDPNAGRTALLSLSLGAAAFAALTLIWDRAFAFWRWATAPRDAAFLG